MLWALPLPSRVSLMSVVDPNGAVWSHTAPNVMCIILSLSPGTGPKESHCLQTPHPIPEPVLSQLACHRGWDSDGLQHLHIFLGRKCQVLQGSISCQQWAGQD